jgi:hypothetical protein
MNQSLPSSPSKSSRTTADEVTEILTGQSKKGILARLLPFLGPAFIAIPLSKS